MTANRPIRNKTKNKNDDYYYFKRGERMPPKIISPKIVKPAFSNLIVSPAAAVKPNEKVINWINETKILKKKQKILQQQELSLRLQQQQIFLQQQEAYNKISKLF